MKLELAVGHAMTCLGILSLLYNWLHFECSGLYDKHKPAAQRFVLAEPIQKRYPLEVIMIDPTIAAAVVTAAGSLLGKLLGLARPSSPDTKAEKVVSKVYDKVADAVTPNSLRTLIVLHDVGAFQTPKQILERAQELALRQEPDGSPFEADITYRLRYLGLLGLVRVGAVDFALTHLGDTFIDHARKDKYRYTKVFTALRQ